MTAREFLDDIAGYLAPGDDGLKIATVDPGYASGRPRVTFDGETVLGGKLYPYLASYTPAKSDRVLLAPVGTGFVILGRIV